MADDWNTLTAVAEMNDGTGFVDTPHDVEKARQHIMSEVMGWFGHHHPDHMITYVPKTGIINARVPRSGPAELEISLTLTPHGSEAGWTRVRGIVSVADPARRWAGAKDAQELLRDALNRCMLLP